MLRAGTFGKVLAAAVLPLAVYGLPHSFSAQSGAVELVNHAQDDEGPDDPTDSWGLWMPRSRDASSGSSSGGQSAAEPDYSESVIDEFLAFARSILAKGAGGSGSAEGGPFSDSPEYWGKIYYDQAMAAASGAVDASAGQTAETTEDPSRLLNNASTTSGSTVEPQSASPAPDPAEETILPPAAASEPITATQADVEISPGPGRSQPSSGNDGDDTKAPKPNGSSGK